MQKGLAAAAFVVGLAVGAVGGFMRWHTGAEQRQEWRHLATETAGVRDQCLATISWQAANLCRCNAWPEVGCRVPRKC